MPSGDTTSPRGHVSFLEPKDLPRWYDAVGDDVRTRVATTTIDGIVLHAILDEQSEYPEATALEDGGETRSAARADCTRSQTPSSRQEQGTPRGSDDAPGDLAAAIPCPVRHLIVQFTPDAQANDPGKTFCDSVVLFNPAKLTIGLDTTQWPSIECCLESLPHRATHFQLCKLLIICLNYEVDAHEDKLKLKTALQQAVIPGAHNLNAVGKRSNINIHLTPVQTTSAIGTGAPRFLVETARTASIHAGCEFTLCCI